MFYIIKFLLLTEKKIDSNEIEVLVKERELLRLKALELTEKIKDLRNKSSMTSKWKMAVQRSEEERAKRRKLCRKLVALLDFLNYSRVSISTIVDYGVGKIDRDLYHIGIIESREELDEFLFRK